MVSETTDPLAISRNPEFMRLALAEAALVVDEVFPYPPVGCLVIHGGHIVARAHNGKPGSGTPHAEIAALLEAQKRKYPMSETVVYSSLEPCCVIGLTQSCSQALIDCGVKEVHVGVEDSYGLIRGKGIRHLQDAGITVVLGEYQREIRHLLRFYEARFCPSCGHPVMNGREGAPK